MNEKDLYSMFLLKLCLWREAQNQTLAAKQAVAWSIKNRVRSPRWWGRDWESVILMPEQYSSFNHNDPNSTKLPRSNDPSWQECCGVANLVFNDPPQISDPTGGATSYFDRSLDGKPPAWSIDGSKIHTADIGAFHFYKEA